MGRACCCVILAAGLGTRMKSSLPKVLHGIFGKPMLGYVLDAAERLRPERAVVVVGNNHGMIAGALGERKGVTYALQKEQRGTAHALGVAVGSLEGFRGTVLVMNGDAPLLRHETLKKFLSLHIKNRNEVSLLSFMADDPASYGRVVRKDGRPLRIVEHKDASAEEMLIREVNSGVYAIEKSALPLLGLIKENRGKKEYYLTDIIEHSLAGGKRTGVYCVGEEEEFLGVNSRGELARALQIMRDRKVRELLESGVSFMDPASVFIAPTVKVGADSLIYPNVYIEGNTTIGKGSTIYPNVRITDSVIKDGVVIKDSCIIEQSLIGRSAELGPFARIRPGSRIGDRAKIGNFVECKKCTIGKGTKAMHLSYLGDAEIGRDVNVGAGTITCNYDGANKHKTIIGDGVFIGSDTQLVAPVKLGRGCYVGAGSTITEDVPPRALALSRTRQRHLMGWAAKKTNNKKAK